MVVNVAVDESDEARLLVDGEIHPDTGDAFGCTDPWNVFVFGGFVRKVEGSAFAGLDVAEFGQLGVRRLSHGLV